MLKVHKKQAQSKSIREKELELKQQNQSTMCELLNVLRESFSDNNKNNTNNSNSNSNSNSNVRNDICSSNNVKTSNSDITGAGLVSTSVMDGVIAEVENAEDKVMQTLDLPNLDALNMLDFTHFPSLPPIPNIGTSSTSNKCNNVQTNRILANNYNKCSNGNNAESHGSLRNMKNQICSICLDKMQSNESIRRLPCLHTFHTQCVDMWLNHFCKGTPNCPICRINVANASINGSNNTTTKNINNNSNSNENWSFSRYNNSNDNNWFDYTTPRYLLEDSDNNESHFEFNSRYLNNGKSDRENMIEWIEANELSFEPQEYELLELTMYSLDFDKIDKIVYHWKRWIKKNAGAYVICPRMIKLLRAIS